MKVYVCRSERVNIIPYIPVLVLQLSVYQVCFNEFVTVAPTVSATSGIQTYKRGDDVTLTCFSMGGPELLYQWQYNGNDLEGERFSTLILSNVTASHGGEYTCVVSNIAGSGSASTFVYISPYFTADPQDAGVSNGSLFMLICEAGGFPVLNYQWIRVGDPIRDDLNVTSMTLIFDPILFEDEGVYVCNVTSAETTISSDTATLSCKEVLLAYNRFWSSVFKKMTLTEGA